MNIWYISIDKLGKKTKEIKQVKGLKEMRQLFYGALDQDKQAVLIERIENPTPEEQKRRIKSKIIVYA